MEFVRLIEFLIAYSFFLLSASVHESAHAWTAFKFGDPTAKFQNRISLNPANHIDVLGTVIIPFLVFLSGIPIIGWAKPTPVNPLNFKNPRKDSMYVSGAGPISNLLCVAFLAVLWHVASFFNPSVYRVAALFCYVFGMGILVNLMLAVFNLLPIHPLDGSGVLEGVLPEQWAESYAMLRPYGFIFLLILFYLPGFQRFISLLVRYLLYFLGIQWYGLEDIW
jgi:Zn-dependent protease